MIELYRHVACETCAEIEESLKEMVIAHKVITVEDGRSVSALPAQTRLPALKEKEKIVSGPEQVALYLKELQKFVTDWRKFQSDACYIDDDGSVC